MKKKPEPPKTETPHAVTVERPKCPRCKTPSIRFDGGSHERGGKRYQYGHCMTCGKALVVISS